MKTQKVLVSILVFVAIIVCVYSVIGNIRNVSYVTNCDSLATEQNTTITIFSDDIPIPSGDLNASDVILLPDLYEEGKGFTCTGLAYDNATDTFLIGEFGALLPDDKTMGSIVRVSGDFSSIVETIPLYKTGTEGVQGVALDTSDNSIWFCDPNGNKIWHISSDGISLGCITTPRPTGIAYNDKDDTFWVLSYDGNIRHITKSSRVLKTIMFSYNEPLDQCFLDKHKGLLYMTAGTNYLSRNNVYCLNINTQEQYIACTVDSYAVEGIWLGDNNKMIILNDGYYHSAKIEKNQANIYTVGS